MFVERRQYSRGGAADGTPPTTDRPGTDEV
jgi:hypothetical protein